MKKKFGCGAVILAVVLIGRGLAPRFLYFNSLPEICKKVKYGMTAKEVESILGRKQSLSTLVGEDKMGIWNCSLGDFYVIFDGDRGTATSACFRRTAPETPLERLQRLLGFRSMVRRWFLF
jgi:hypothetical protein